jgi:ribosomal small subunit protein bTHX
MGKGDKKSKKGKRFKHSYGKTRIRKKGRSLSSRKKVSEKPKTIEHKKPHKVEAETLKPVEVIEPKVDEVKINEPEVTEIKEEVKIPEVKEEAVSQVPEIVQESVKEEQKSVEQGKETPKTETKDEEPEAPKKRGRPKKKKEE